MDIFKPFISINKPIESLPRVIVSKQDCSFFWVPGMPYGGHDIQFSQQPYERHEIFPSVIKEARQLTQVLNDSRETPKSWNVQTLLCGSPKNRTKTFIQSQRAYQSNIVPMPFKDNINEFELQTRESLWIGRGSHSPV